MIELTAEQQNTIARESEMPLRVLDPVTNTKYVLVREEVFEQARRLLTSNDGGFVREMTPRVMEIFGRDGWDDPAMDVYNDLDPRPNP